MTGNARPLLRLITAVSLAALALMPAGSAAGQEGVDVRIREAALAEDGATRLVVSVTGDGVPPVLGAEAFAVREAGNPVEGVNVEPLLESRSQPVAVALVIDVSGSTRGEPLANAKSAAKAFVESVAARGVRVGIIAFGQTAQFRASFTTDRQALASTIDALEAGGETALFDAVTRAAQELRRVPGQRNIIVFSDGADTASSVSLPQAVATAKDIDASVSTVALVTEEFNQAALDRLAAETGGRKLAVAEAEALSGAFRAVAHDLASQYVVSYASRRVEPKELEVSVTVAAAGGDVSDSVVVINNRVPPPPELRRAPVPQPLLAALSGDAGLYAGVAAAFIALALLLGVGFSRPRGGRAERLLHQGMRFYGRGGDEAARPRTGSRDSASIARRAVQLADHLPKPEGFEERLQAQIDRAGWPMRASEFLLVQIGSTLGTAILALALSRSLVVTVLALPIGFFAPRLVLRQKIDKRASAFLEQLPDTLQLLSGSLRAGYGLLQAIDTVVQEAPEPTATEFARALTEARLGMPLDEALEGMADRLGSEDFRWVVLAINIQRQVGGNLAALLETVGNTLREREMVRRQIKTLSAEGRLSAIVLTALPFVFAGYLLLVNPDYIMLLFTRMFGLIMVGVGLVLVGLGALWMRKMINIEV